MLAFDFLRMIRGILFPRARACPGQINCASADGHAWAANAGELSCIIQMCPMDLGPSCGTARSTWST